MQETNAVVTYPGFDIGAFLHPIISFFTNKQEVFDTVSTVFGITIAVCVVLTVALLVGILVSVEGIRHIRKKENKIFNAPVDMAYKEVAKGDEHLAKRWDMVQNHLESQNQNDWRQAIIEADAILDNLLTKLGYQGEGMGEKLRRAERADFKTLDQAGEAHGVRNKIAHDTSGFLLSHHEARRVINLYRQVFEEFYFI